MVRTVVLYSDREYSIDKCITGYNTVRIDGIYGSNVNSRLKAITQEGYYVRGWGFTSVKEFCKKIGIHVNDDDVILLTSYKLIDAVVLRGNFDNGLDLVQEYYGKYNGKYGERFTYCPVA
jgi:hypothetical protein